MCIRHKRMSETHFKREPLSRICLCMRTKREFETLSDGKHFVNGTLAWADSRKRKLKLENPNLIQTRTCLCTATRAGLTHSQTGNTSQMDTCLCIRCTRTSVISFKREATCSTVIIASLKHFQTGTCFTRLPESSNFQNVFLKMFRDTAQGNSRR